MRTEGKASILQSGNDVFFNPAQVINRDMSLSGASSDGRQHASGLLLPARLPPCRCSRACLPPPSAQVFHHAARGRNRERRGAQGVPEGPQRWAGGQGRERAQAGRGHPRAGGAGGLGAARHQVGGRPAGRRAGRRQRRCKRGQRRRTAAPPTTAPARGARAGMPPRRRACARWWQTTWIPRVRAGAGAGAGGGAATAPLPAAASRYPPAPPAWPRFTRAHTRSQWLSRCGATSSSTARWRCRR